MTRDEFIEKLDDYVSVQLLDNINVYNYCGSIEITDADGKVTEYDDIEQAFNHKVNGVTIEQIVEQAGKDLQFMTVLDDRDLVIT